MTEDWLHAAVLRALPRWPLAPGATARAINRSENTTFQLEEPGGRSFALRVHRRGYNGRAEIASELAWIAALRAHGVLLTPAPLAGRDGMLIQRVDGPDGALAAVAFAFVPGTMPAGDLPGCFHVLGGISARLHTHAVSWDRPSWFTRRRWDDGAMFGPDAIWGDWRAGIDAIHHELLARGEAHIRAFLDAFGEAPDRFGLIHADLRLTNLLTQGMELHVIDFDDCGFGWFAYDFAAAVSFLEDAPELPDLRDAWLAGYRAVRCFPEEQLAAIPVLVAARRLLLTAWLASHPGAMSVGPEFQTGTVRVIETMLAGPWR